MKEKVVTIVGDSFRIHDTFSDMRAVISMWEYGLSDKVEISVYRERQKNMDDDTQYVEKLGASIMISVTELEHLRNFLNTRLPSKLKELERRDERR